VTRRRASTSADLREANLALSRTGANRARFMRQTSLRGADRLRSSVAGMPSTLGACPGCKRTPTIFVPAANRATNGSVHGPTTTGGSSLINRMSTQASGSTRCAYSRTPTKAQKIVRKVCGNWEFPIVRDNRPLMCFKIHRSPKSRRIAVLPTSYLGLLASDGRLFHNRVKGGRPSTRNTNQCLRDERIGLHTVRNTPSHQRAATCSSSKRRNSPATTESPYVLSHRLNNPCVSTEIASTAATLCRR